MLWLSNTYQFTLSFDPANVQPIGSRSGKSLAVAKEYELTKVNTPKSNTNDPLLKSRNLVTTFISIAFCAPSVESLRLPPGLVAIAVSVDTRMPLYFNANSENCTEFALGDLNKMGVNL